ncbi:hypothetical protein [Hoeflea sp.]|uniref:hypothetical protein n=1 Tax=Hoeflea sp. TaxID=1940281 RepID=UPI003A924D70
MLNAMLSGKAGRIGQGSEISHSWREIVKISEDVLTDLVFTRLSYLSADIFWNVLNVSFKLGSPNYRVAALKSIEFWPNWDNATDDGVRVEPDCHLVFELGDPAKVVSVLIEAKLGDLGNSQTSSQWHREWRAYEKWQKEGDLAVEDTYFLALGGLGHSVRSRVQGLKADVASKGSNVPAYGASWSDLTQALSRIDPANEQNQRILNDVASALALVGHRSIRPLEDIIPIGPEWQPVNYYSFQEGK